MKEMLSVTAERQALIERHLPLVHWVISEYFHTNSHVVGLEYEDLVQEGMIALCHAADTYKTGRSAFSTYAVRVVRNHLTSHCRVVADKLRNMPTMPLDRREFQDRRDYEQDSLSGLCANEILNRRKKTYTGSARRGVEALEMKVLMGYGVTDIARVCSVKPNLVGAWISKAAKQMRMDLTGDELDALGVENRAKAA